PTRAGASPPAASTNFVTVTRSGRLQLAVTLDGASGQINAIVQAVTDTELLYNCDRTGQTNCFIEAWNIGPPAPVGDVQIQLQTPVRQLAIHVRPCTSATTTFSVVGPAVLPPTACPIASGPEQWIHPSGVGDITTVQLRSTSHVDFDNLFVDTQAQAAGPDLETTSPAVTVGHSMSPGYVDFTVTNRGSTDAT